MTDSPASDRKKLRWRRILFWVLISPLLLVLLVAGLLYVPPVQQWAVEIAARKASEATGMQIGVGRIRLGFPLHLSLRDITAIQADGDTLADIGRVRLQVSFLPLLHKQVEVPELGLYDASIHYKDSLGLTDLKLKAALIEGAHIALDPASKRMGLGQWQLSDADVVFYSADTTAADTAKKEPFDWQLALDRIDLNRVTARVEMPLDSLYLKTYIGQAAVADAKMDVADMLYNVGMVEIGGGANLTYDTDDSTPMPDAFDYRHIGLSAVALQAKDICFHDGDLELRIVNGSLRERDRLTLRRLSGNYRMDDFGIYLSRFALDTENSRISCDARLPWSLFDKDPTAVMELDLEASLNLEDIRYLAGENFQLPSRRLVRYPETPISIAISTFGSLDELTVEHMSLFWEGMADMDGGGLFTKVLDDRRRAGNFTLNLGFHQNASGLLAFYDKALYERFAIPAGMTVAAELNIRRGMYSGKVTLTERSGSISLDGDYIMGSDKYRADMRVDGLDLRAFMPKDSIGPVVATLHAEGRGFDLFNTKNVAQANVSIHTLDWKGYKLDSITFDAALEKGSLFASFNSTNSLLNGSIQLDALLGRNLLDGSVMVRMDSANFNALGLADTTFSTNFILEGHLKSDLDQTHRFEASMPKCFMRLERYRVNLDRIDILADTDPDSIRLDVSSGDLKMALRVGEGINAVTAISESLGKKMEAMRSDSIHRLRLSEVIRELPHTSFTMEARRYNPLRDYMEVNGMIFSTIQTQLTATPERGLEGFVEMQGFQRDTIRIDRIRLDLATLSQYGVLSPDSVELAYVPDSILNSYDRVLRLTLSVDKSRYRRQPAMYGRIVADATLQGVDVRLSLADGAKQEAYRLGLHGFWNEGGMGINVMDTEPVVLAYNHFTANENNRIFYRSSDERLFANLELTSADKQYLSVFTTDTIADMEEINVNIRNLRLQQYARLTPLPDMAGSLFAYARLSRTGGAGGTLTATGDVSVNDLAYEGKPIGNIASSLFYEPRNNDSHYLTAEISYNGNPALNIDGIYHAEDRNNNFDIKAMLNGFPLAIANPFIGAERGSLAGFMDGELEIKGKADAPLIDGNLAMRKASFFSPMVGNTFYFSEKPLVFDRHKLIFDNYLVHARQNEKEGLSVDGEIILTGARAMTAALQVKADNMTMLNSKKSQSDLLYGKLIASTNLLLRGPLDAMTIRGSLDIHGGTSCTYVYTDVDLGTESMMGDVVSFIDFSDTIVMPSQSDIDKERTFGGMDLLLRIHIDPVVEFGVDLSSGTQDRLDLQGGGDLSFSMPAFGEMSMTGRYEMSGGGKMVYTLPVVGKQVFTIDPSSYVQWSGNVQDPYVNFKAVQRVRADVMDGGNKTTRKVNFDVGVIVKETLTHMDLAFDVEAPEDITIQSQLQGMGAEERSKQAIGLLATGTYLASQSAGFSFDNALSSYAQGMINSALGKVFEGSGLNIGMENHDGTDGSGTYTDFTYSFSKQFYNNRIRVVIGGAVASGSNIPTNKDRSLVDNVALEYRLDQAGAQHLKLFHKKNNENLLEGEITETGVGYVISRKLARLSDLFRFGNKKKEMKPSTTVEALKPKEETTAIPEEAAN